MKKKKKTLIILTGKLVETHGSRHVRQNNEKLIAYALNRSVVIIDSENILLSIKSIAMRYIPIFCIHNNKRVLFETQRPE